MLRAAACLHAACDATCLLLLLLPSPLAAWRRHPCGATAAPLLLAQEGGDVLVRVLSVPEACQPGDAVFQEGGAAPREYPKECKVRAGSRARAPPKWVGSRCAACACRPPPSLAVQSKQWKAILEGPLNVAGGVARFKGTPLVTPHGPVTVVAMPDGAGIH